MDEAKRDTGADFKGAPSPSATRPGGAEGKFVVGFIIAAVLVIGALIYWAM